ncbi:MAG: hypothetical protein CSB48_11475 [Proteobacteria bacterium]|nr:MAG: hypothetical protein CSB48_11475 [Pseudomonadota bacterium]PIE40095.1 MAG: hypothetical protein CSA51_02330 [Gammaproteobacteria bacterium]
MSGLSEEERWCKLEEVFTAASAMQGDEQEAYLQSECGDDNALLAEVRELLSANDITVEKGWLEGENTPKTFSHDDHIDDYRVLGLLGRGATGEVYKVVNEWGKEYAIKCLPLIFCEDSEILTRFKKEAEVTQQLIHPNINRMHGFFTSSDNVPYLLMDYCDGRVLSDILSEYRLTISQAFHIFEQICRGLRCAHDKGICHRDVKPSNVMLEEGVIKIIDFGIAKDAASTLTATGVRLGSPAYMSPEQWVGKGVDYRADMWSLGVILYELLTGRLPFSGKNFYDMQQSVLKTEPLAASKINPELNHYIDRFLSFLMQKNPDKRPRNLSDILHNLPLLVQSVSS